MDKNLKILVVDGSRVSRSMISATLAAQAKSDRVFIKTAGSA